jgi:hypothetical protein
MRREIKEILASQKQMLIRRGTYKDGGPSDERMADIMLRHVNQVIDWMGKQENIRFLEVSYNEMLVRPHVAIQNLVELLDGQVGIEAMHAVIDPNLYRQRK